MDNVTFEEAYNYLKDIPEDKFFKGGYYYLDQYCALGHLSKQFLGHNDGIPRDLIYNPFEKTVTSGGFSEISYVNDGSLINNSDLNNYITINSTPKERVLNYLKDVIAEGSGNCKIFIKHGERV